MEQDLTREIDDRETDDENVQKTESAAEHTEQTEQKDPFNWSVGIISIVSFVAFWLGALLFLLGGATANNENLNIVSAINLFLSLFSLKKATIYSTLSGVAIAVMYIVILIKLVCAIFPTIKLFVKSLHGDTHQERGKATVDLYYSITDTFMMYYVMMLVSYMLTGGALNVYSILIIVLNVVVSLLAAVLGPIRSSNPADNGNLTDRILDCARKILMVAAVCLLIYLLAEPAVLEVRNGFKLLFSGYYNEPLGAWGVIVNIYSCVVRPVLICVSIILLMNLFHGYTKYLFPRRNSNTIYTYKLKASTITVLVIVCVIAVLDLLFLFGEYTGEVALDTATIENWLRVSKNTLIPAVLAAAGAVVLSSATGKISRE